MAEQKGIYDIINDIKTDRGKIGTKFASMGIANANDQLSALATKSANITVRTGSAVTLTDSTRSHSVPIGYHKNSYTVALKSTLHDTDSANAYSSIDSSMIAQGVTLITKDGTPITGTLDMGMTQYNESIILTTAKNSQIIKTPDPNDNDITISVKSMVGSGTPNANNTTKTVTAPTSSSDPNYNAFFNSFTINPMPSGAYSAAVSSHTTTNASASSSVAGTITGITSTSAPSSGTDGTDYYTITPSLTTGNGSSSVTAEATIDTAGHLATGNKTASDNKAVGVTKSQGGNRYLTLSSFGAETGTDPGSTVTNYKTIAPGTASKYVPVSAGYMKAGKITVSAMPAGAYAASVSSHTVSSGSATSSVTGTVTNISVTTAPSGTDGTDYYTITPNLVVANGSSSVTAKATVSTSGYIAADNKTASNNKAVSVTKTQGANRYITLSTPSSNGTTNPSTTTTPYTNVATISRNTDAQYVKIPKGYNNTDRMFTISAVDVANPIFDGGALSIASSSTAASGSNVTISEVTSSNATNGIEINTSGKAKAKRADVLYNGDVDGYVVRADNAVALASATMSTDATLSTKKYKITALNVPKDVPFTITTTADTAYDTTSNLTITNGQFRNVSVTNDSTGSKNGVTTVTGGTAKIKVGTDTQTVMENGAWNAPTVDRADTYYGKVVVGGGSVTLNSPTITPSKGAVSVNGATVTIPITGSANITPTVTAGYVSSVSGSTASIDGSVSYTYGSGSATISGSIGVSQGTATLNGTSVSIPMSGSKSLTPTVTAGYISSGTAGTVSASGTATYTIPTETRTASVPSTSGSTVTRSTDKFMTSVAVPAIPSLSITIAAADWPSSATSGWYSVSKTATGVTASNHVVVVPSNDTYKATAQSCGVYASAQGAGTLTFKAAVKPSASIVYTVYYFS